MRLHLVPQDTKWDFLRWGPAALGLSGVLMAVSVVLFFVMGLNYGIDFRGGTTIRTESAQTVDVGAYRDALAPLGLGDVSITEVFDPGFGPDRNVAMVRIQAQEGAEAVTPETIARGRGSVAGRRSGHRFPVGGIGRAQGFGRVDPHRDPGGDARHRGGAGLYLAAFRMAVLGRRGGRADP
jgi:preprotein translocase subunit SecF